MKKLIANNPYTPRLQDPPPSKLPCNPGESIPRAAEYGGLVFLPTTFEERQSMFFYGKEN